MIEILMIVIDVKMSEEYESTNVEKCVRTGRIQE